MQKQVTINIEDIHDAMTAMVVAKSHAQKNGYVVVAEAYQRALDSMKTVRNAAMVTKNEKITLEVRC